MLEKLESGIIVRQAELMDREAPVSSLVFSAPPPTNHAMNLAVETEQETDGRWIGEIPQIPGVMAYGATRREAISRVEALALRVLADRLDLGDMPRERLRA
jgi:predicted RNase H-like HicB family nuclease